MKYPQYTHSIDVQVELPPKLQRLKRLADNLHWTWSHASRSLFREIDRKLWNAVEHNPTQLLSQVSPERLNRLAEDEAFLNQLHRCDEELSRYLAATTWFSERRPDASQNDVVAYFCAEFGITEALPIYSGGLGVLAGDHLKAASDLGLPLVGVGLLYSRGYFRQSLTQDGWQQERYPQSDFFKLPIELIRDENGEPRRVAIEFPDRTITCHMWNAEVGRIRLILLDSNVLENEPDDQSITDTLYGGDSEMRIRQEIILGVGGMRALQQLGLRPVVCHMNEGHAAFLSLERIRQLMQSLQTDFRTAQKIVARSSVFTTHTPVPAGFDLFPADLLEKYTTKLISPLGLDFKTFVRLGRLDPENEGEAFNMAILAMDNAIHVNGVSKLHAKVTRGMFHSRWDQFPEDEAPVIAITNGIHTGTWIGRQMAELFDERLGPAWRERAGDPESWRAALDIPDDELWDVRENQRGDLVRYIRRHIKGQWSDRGLAGASLASADSTLDPRVLTIGFARRFATYKRATLMLSDRERLKSILHHPERPVQIVIAGKSHPKDDGGKALIQELFKFVHEEGGSARIALLEDYDLEMARRLVQGVDVWLNNPRRPYEASGTSGMKVVPNGGLNCSSLDGWWDEGYNPEVGWAIGDGREYADAQQQDWIDSQSLYNLIEHEIAPKFYHRVSGAVPSDWMKMVKRSIATLTPQFSTYRMVSDYAQKFYFEAWDAFEALTANNLERAKTAVAWEDRITAAFSKVRIDQVNYSSGPHGRVGDSLTVVTQAYLDGLAPEDVRAEVLVGPIGSNREIVGAAAHTMQHVGKEGDLDRFELTFELAETGRAGLTVRLAPSHPDVAVPAELPVVRWESAVS